MLDPDTSVAAAGRLERGANGLIIGGLMPATSAWSSTAASSGSASTQNHMYMYMQVCSVCENHSTAQWTSDEGVRNNVKGRITCDMHLRYQLLNSKLNQPGEPSALPL